MRVLLAARDYLPKVGGLQQSVYELARRLETAAVYTLRDPDSPNPFDRSARAFRRVFGLDVISTGMTDSVQVFRTTSAVGTSKVMARFRPNAVVANAGANHTHRFVKTVLDSTPPGAARGLYIRDIDAVSLVGTVESDVVFVNCEHLAQLVRARCRQPVHMVPSIVETARSMVNDGRHILFINPVPDRGLQLATDIAALLPGVPFRFLESWALPKADREAVRRKLSDIHNVELWRAVANTDVYEGARALIVPYLVPNRPRVVLEAMSAGVPVVGLAEAGVGEAMAGGGVAISREEPASRWADVVSRIHADDTFHADLVHAGLRRLRHPDADPGALTRQFLAAIGSC